MADDRSDKFTSVPVSDDIPSFEEQMEKVRKERERRAQESSGSAGNHGAVLS